MNQVEQISIRFANIEDVETLAELAAQLGYPSSVEETRKRFLSLDARKEEAAVIVAEENNQVIGWVQVHIYRLLMDAPEVEIGGIVVDERHRGRGVGAILIEAAEKWTRDCGYDSVYLRANAIRERAHKFYKELGYEIVKNQFALRKKIK